MSYTIQGFYYKKSIELFWDDEPIQGPPGPKGDRGVMGPPGPAGPNNGPIGEMGPMGPKGLKGDKGNKGDKGEIGPIGPPGRNAETVFFKVKGPQGIPGKRGLPGIRGEKGDRGKRGFDGLTGPSGLKGPQGERGIQGNEGIQGISGIPGIQGIPGIRGPKGETGPRGRGFAEIINMANINEVNTSNEMNIIRKYLIPDIHYDKNKNIGIGINTPKSKLDIEGDVMANKLCIGKSCLDEPTLNKLTNKSDDLDVKGNITTNGDITANNISINKPNKLIFAGNDNDRYYLQKIGNTDSNHLRLTINDNSNESLQIWGNSCGTTGCGGEGVMQHKFDTSGNAYHKNQLCLGNTCINEDKLNKIITPPTKSELCIGNTCINETQLKKIINIKPITNSKIRFGLHCSFGGWNKSFGIGEYPNVESLAMTGGISSIEIPSDLDMVGFSGYNFTGDSIWFKGYKKINCLVSHGWNDRIRSMKIRQQ